jgi:hypothetical protein
VRCSICDFIPSGLNSHDYGPEYKKAIVVWNESYGEFVCSVCQKEVDSVDWPLEEEDESGSFRLG